MAVISKICGMLKRSLSNNTVSNEAVTINAAFKILFAAIMRERFSTKLRDCTSANSGTMNNPDEIAINSIQVITFQTCGCARNCCTLKSLLPSASGQLKYRPTLKMVIPKAPKGTSPISRRFLDNTSHSTAPIAEPIENTASKTLYAPSWPPSVSLA